MSKSNQQQGDMDWRFRTVTTLAEDWESPWTGNVHPKGTPVSVTTYVEHDDKELPIGDPSAPAIYLSFANKVYELAIDNHPFTNLEINPEVVNSRFTYDYLENIMASIVFSLTALEAFANEEIPEDYQYEYERESGIFEYRDKEYVERYISLSEKLGSILPEVKEKESPKGTSIWEQYVYLKRKRDRIIHLKSSDRQTSSKDELYPDSIWSHLLDPDQPNYPKIAFQLIEYFVDDENYHWVEFSPLKR